MSTVIKMKMSIAHWNEINKITRRINATRKNKIAIEKYIEVSKYGKLLYDLTCVEVGAREDIENVEYYL